MAMDNNILYLDVKSSLVKHSHHVQFNKAWYLQLSRPPAAQLLYDLGVEPDKVDFSAMGALMAPPPLDFWLPGTVKPIVVLWPPMMPMMASNDCIGSWPIPKESTMLPLPLQLSVCPPTCCCRGRLHPGTTRKTSRTTKV